MSRRLPRAVPTAAAALLLALLCALAVAAVPARAAKRAQPAAVALTQLTASGQKLTLRGRVTLPHDGAAQRRRARVAFTLTGGGRSERFAAGVDARRGFKLTRATRLSGRLTLSLRLTLGGRTAGRTVRRALTVRRASVKPPVTGGGTPAPQSPAAPAQTPQGAVPLIGLFKLDPGVARSDRSFAGTYFRMFGPNDAGSLHNGSSRAPDRTYTLLEPGSDGGLRTDAYQPLASPAFVNDGSVDNGDSLSERVTKPTPFFGKNFSIATEADDVQARLPGYLNPNPALVPVPIPAIVHRDGALSGQVTAWNALWNGSAFNQGTPKPDGSIPAGSTPLTGAYDAATRHFVLEWRSLIVGGPFDKFSGYWHLEGTFVPASQ